MKAKDLVLTALLIAIVFLATNLRVPTTPAGGLVHLGSLALFVISVVFGPKKGAAAGAAGMALFNLTTEFAAWAPFTFLTRAVMGLVIGYIANARWAGGKRPFLNVLALVVGGLWFIPAMYVSEMIIFGVPWQVPAASVPGNVMQLVIALVAGLPLIYLINRHRVKLGI